MIDQRAVMISVVAMRVFGFALAVIIRFGIGLAALAAGASLPIGMMFVVRDGWF